MARAIALLLLHVFVGGGAAFLLPPPVSRAVSGVASRKPRGLVRRSSSQQPPKVDLNNLPFDDEDNSQFFKLTKGLMEFGAQDKVEMVMFEEHDHICRYITASPERIILATWDEKLVDRRAEDIFRLTTRPVQFVTLTLQPSIDIKVWEEDKMLHIRSQACMVPGLEHILGRKFADSLNVEVQGCLRAVPDDRGSVRLVGDVVFFTSGRLPLILSLTPRAVLESAAAAVNKRIMSYAKERFIKNLAVDFSRWMEEEIKMLEVAGQKEEQPAASSNKSLVGQ